MLGFIDPAFIGGGTALAIGMLLVLTGLYSLRKSRFRTRQGASVLAGLSTFVGVITSSIGALYVFSVLWR